MAGFNLSDGDPGIPSLLVTFDAEADQVADLFLPTVARLLSASLDEDLRATQRRVR